jgi:hypothetical protein
MSSAFPRVLTALTSPVLCALNASCLVSRPSNVLPLLLYSGPDKALPCLHHSLDTLKALIWVTTGSISYLYGSCSSLLCAQCHKNYFKYSVSGFFRRTSSHLFHLGLRHKCLHIHRGLTPVPSKNTKTHMCSSPLYKMALYLLQIHIRSCG